MVEGGGRREEIRDAVRGGPGDRDRAIRGLREREDVIAARTGDAGGSDVVNEQVGSVHTNDVLAEGDSDLREVGEVAGRRSFREDDWRGGVRADGDVHGGGGGGEAGVIACDSGKRVAAGGEARDVEAVGRGGVVGELSGVRVEGDVGDGAVAVGSGRGNGEAGWRTVEGVVRGRGEGDERRQIRRGGEDGVELGFHGDVGAGERALMNFDGEDVISGDERGGGKLGLIEGIVGCASCERSAGDVACGHVDAMHFDAVEINNRAVVPQKAEIQGGHLSGIRNGERASEVSGGVLGGGICSEAHSGDDAVATRRRAVAERSDAVGP